MGFVVRSVLAVWALLAAWAWGEVAAGLPGPRPYDGLGDDPAAERIEWKESWEATYKANLARWEAEVRQQTRDERERGLRLRIRAVRLLDALIARYPNEAEKRLEALKEIAGNYYACNLNGRGNYALKRLVEECPGQVDLAAAALHRILAECAEDRQAAVEDWVAWLDYAATRLTALNESGGLPDGHPAVALAWRALGVARRAQGRLLEAAEALDALEVHTGRDDEWEQQEGELLLAAGREREALARFQDLYSRHEQNGRARDRTHYLLGHPPSAPPSYASHFGIEMKWEAVHSSPPGEVAERISDVLREDVEGKNLAPWTGAQSLGARHASLWAQLDRHLLSQPPEALAPLRQAQEAEARKLRISDFGFRIPQSAIGNRQSAMALAGYRRLPWAAAAQRLLLDYGEDALRRGQRGLALRAFRDVLSHATDAALRAQAVGGARLSAAAASPPEAEVPLSALERRLLRLPPTSAWPQELAAGPYPHDLVERLWPAVARSQAGPGGVLVAGPELLAFYGDDPQRPLWLRTPSGPRGKHGRLDLPDAGIVVAPGVFQPAMADGCVFTRWGLEETRRFLTGVAAFDLRTGELLWSTATNPAWDNLWPVSDPVVAEGRLYVLALHQGYAGILPVSTASLACLDAATGAVLWRRALASQNITLIPTPDSNYREYQFDLAHYGNAVAVADGAVYCQTNLGFAARCDARDGQIEWTANYSRVPLAWNVPRVVRRQGAPPFVAGDRVVCVPRDALGAFAVDCASGKLLWENPYAPSDEAIGLRDGLLLVNDGQMVAALDAATGQPRWRRHFPGGIRCTPRLQGSSLYVAAGQSIERLEATTGRHIESGDWGALGPMAAFALTGRTLIGVGPQSIGSDDKPLNRPLNPQAPAAGQGQLRLPLVQSWKLLRPNPTLWVPPPEAKLDGKLLLASQGVLECLRATPQGGVEWQFTLRPGHQGMVWTEKALLLVYPWSVAALDTKTGRLLWEAEAPFRIRQWQETPACLVLGEYTETDRSKDTCALDLASGKLLWRRDFRELGWGYDNNFHGIGWDGKSVHLLASLSQYGGGGHFDVLCEPADGRITAVRRFLAKGREWPILFSVGEGGGFYVDQDRVAYDFALDGSPHRRHDANLRDLNPLHFRRLGRTRRRLQKSEDWVQIYQYEDYPNFRHTLWTLQQGNPSYELRRARPGAIRGNQLFEVEDGTLKIVDLPSRKEFPPYRLILPAHRQAKILDYCEEGNSLLVVSGIERGPYTSAMTPYRMQVDVFEKATGRPLARQLLDDVPYWRFALYHDWRSDPLHHTQVAWGSGLLFLTDADGLIALAPSARDEPPPEKPVQVAHRVAAPIAGDGRPPALDGWFDDWDPRQAIPVPGPAGRSGSLYLAHDVANLYLAFTYPCPAAATRRGAGAYGDGDWLEVALAAGEHTRHFTVGADEHGRAAWEAVEGGLPAGLRGAVRHDAAQQRLAYEFVVPLKEFARRNDSRRGQRLRLAVSAWQTLPGRQPERILSWGDPWWGPGVLQESLEPVYLHPLTREGEEAGIALAHELPELDEAWDFFEDSCELRASRRPSPVLAGLYRDYLKRHPNGPPAERALLALDRALRNGLENDPAAEVLRIAQEAGVAEPVRARYARLAKGYISLWLHTDTKKLPAGVMLQFHDGRERWGWGHRVAWGLNPWRSDWGEPGTPSNQYAGPVPQADGWQELRIPLVWIDLQDKPLCGISFAQHGGGRLVWDRCSVVYDGGERVILDDEPPKAKEVVGQWSWVTEPRKSGSRAHTDANPGGESDTMHRNIEGLQAPVVEHLIPPATGAVLSQWVYLDPARPPRTIALSLQARGDPYRLVWGQPLDEGRYMGPLPAPGQWHELRVPLAWTPCAGWPLRGFAFEDVGGRTYWDRTAILRDGKEHVIIEDATPEGSTRGNGQWVEKPVKSGTKAHTHPPEQGYEAHGVVYLRYPVTQHLGLDPAREALVLQEQIPKLGPTEAAWHFYCALRDLPSASSVRTLDRIRWFFSVLPDHPQNVSLLKSLVGYFEDVKDPAPLAAVEKVMEETHLPKAIRAAFRRQCGTAEPSFIRTWRVLGPFPSPKGAGFAKPYPPEADRVELDRDYDVIGGTARWRFHSSEADFVDLAKLFKPNEHVVAYAVCWVRSTVAQAVSFEIGSDDYSKLWLNRKLLAEYKGSGTSQPRQQSVAAELRAGWNEVLLKIDQGTRQWGFHLELLDAEARGLLREVTVSTTPPAGRE